MDDNINVLNEIHKGLVLSLSSLSSISSSVSDNDFRKILSNQYDEYNKMLNKVNSEFTKRGTNPKQIDSKTKVYSYMNNKLNSITDKSSSNISKILIRGTSMEILNTHKLINKNLDLSFDIKNLLYDYISKQEQDVETLKEWL